MASCMQAAEKPLRFFKEDPNAGRLALPKELDDLKAVMEMREYVPGTYYILREHESDVQLFFGCVSCVSLYKRYEKESPTAVFLREVFKESQDGHASFRHILGAWQTSLTGLNYQEHYKK